MAASSSSAWDLKRPSQNRPVQVVLPVGLAGDGFVQDAHEPGDVGEAGAPFLDDFPGFFVRRFGVVLAPEVTLHQHGGAEQLGPALDDFPLGPDTRGVGIDAQDEVVVVAHHRVGADVHAEDGGQGLDLADQPLAAVFVVLAGEGVDAAEEGAAHAAGDAVVVRGVGEADLGGAGSCHGIRVSDGGVGCQRLVGVPHLPGCQRLVGVPHLHLFPMQLSTRL